jgi:hypothetical protein
MGSPLLCVLRRELRDEPLVSRAGLLALAPLSALALLRARVGRPPDRVRIRQRRGFLGPVGVAEVRQQAKQRVELVGGVEVGLPPVVAGRRAGERSVRGQALDQDAELAQGDLPAPELADGVARRVVVAQVRLDGLGMSPEDV